MHAKKRLFFTKILLFRCKVIKKSEISILRLNFFHAVIYFGRAILRFVHNDNL